MHATPLSPHHMEPEGVKIHLVYLCILLGVRGSPVLTPKGSLPLSSVTHFLIWVTGSLLGIVAWQQTDLSGRLICEGESVSFPTWRVGSFSALAVSLSAQLHVAAASWPHLGDLAIVTRT